MAVKINYFHGWAEFYCHQVINSNGKRGAAFDKEKGKNKKTGFLLTQE
ncbi:MAG: hypothetical protein PHE84_12060 [bacterium]|nr:hypothetical protein [bacterium]